ncbi:TonB-dependent receptor domain-containing protein [Ancylobacter dichloromethanicus]
MFSGSMSGYYRSNGNVVGVDVNLNAANDAGSVNYTGGWVRADDYRSGDGTTIKSTMYETQNHALSLSRKLDDGVVTLQLGGQFIPYQGYVNQYMDMVDNKSFFVNGTLEKNFEWGQLEANAFYNHVRHTMGFIAPDKTGDMPMDTRTSDMGFRVKGTLEPTGVDIVRLGNEIYYSQLDDWWPPVDGSMMMGPDTFWNINDGQRLRVGVFAEWERTLSQQWTAILGARSDVVWMNTGDVQGYNEMMYGANAAAFNALDHARTDINIDGSAILRYQPDEARQFEIGLARKTRSPNLYERYSWSTNAMAMSMIGWFGDGNGYVGNIDLEPEKGPHRQLHRHLARSGAQGVGGAGLALCQLCRGLYRRAPLRPAGVHREPAGQPDRDRRLRVFAVRQLRRLSLRREHRRAARPVGEPDLWPGRVPRQSELRARPAGRWGKSVPHHAGQRDAGARPCARQLDDHGGGATRRCQDRGQRGA